MGVKPRNDETQLDGMIRDFLSIMDTFNYRTHLDKCTLINSNSSVFSNELPKKSVENRIKDEF